MLFDGCQFNLHHLNHIGKILSQPLKHRNKNGRNGQIATQDSCVIFFSFDEKARFGVIRTLLTAPMSGIKKIKGVFVESSNVGGIGDEI